jgi:1-acyl-sn-glycerol-3-phosphate acyltransferase
MIAGAIRLITGAQARWDCEPSRADGTIPQRIYFANHASNLDAPVIWASLPTRLRRITRPVAARDYWERGAIRRFLAGKVFRVVLIERQHVTRTANPLAAMEAVLDAGESLILFPEGTRSDSEEGDIGKFKPGLWHLARRRADLELVPVYLENLNRILPKGELLFVPLLAAVRFGQPLKPLEDEDKGAFLERAQKAVADLARAAED